MEKKYVLKVVRSNMTTGNGFKWGGVGETTVAPDWDPTPVCGGGLHGWLNGVGYTGCQSISDSEEALWLALEVEGEVVDLDRKVKFERAKTLFVGKMSEAAAVVAAHAGERGAVIGIVRSAGDESTVSGGDWSTVSGGDESTVSGGDWSTVSGGDESTVSGGDESTVSGREGSTVSGGPGSVLQLAYWDSRTRLVTAYVGENGIKPNTPYRLNKLNQFEEVVGK